MRVTQLVDGVERGVDVRARPRDDDEVRVGEVAEVVEGLVRVLGRLLGDRLLGLLVVL